jgi:hypothetical protein
MPDVLVTVPAAAPSTATAGLTTVSVEVGPTAASATGSGGGFAAGSVVSPAAAVATAAGGTFTADQVFEPESAVASASGPTPTVTSPSGSITVSPAAAAATAQASNVWLLSDFLCGEYGAGFYGAGFYGICSVIEMSLFATTWDLAYTTDDASDPTPTWVNVDQGDVRSVDVARGRDDELGRVDAGTAQIVLNNLTRSFDPQVVTGLRPMNRWRVRAIHNAVTYDVFLGYAESYEQSWPALGFDAITTVRLVDEFKLLALDTLPTMNPPTAMTYRDVVMHDTPDHYWDMGFEGNNGLIRRAITGNVLLAQFGAGTMTMVPPAIVGEYEPNAVYNGYASSVSGVYFANFDPDTSLPGPPTPQASGLTAFSYEQWFASSEATPAANRVIAEGPYDAAAAPQWVISLTTTGKIAAAVKNASLATVTATGATSISANTWYHIAVTYDGSNIRVYLNGVQDGIQAQTGAVVDADAAGSDYFFRLNRASGAGTRSYDEPAFYYKTVSADRLLAHYEAGALRGYGEQAPEDRAAALVADSSSVAATDLNSTIGREIIPVFQHGQSVLEELRRAEYAEQGFLFVAKDGTITMLQAGYQGIAPYNVVQCTFDDDGTDLGYRDLTLQYDETFLYNEITTSIVGGELYTDDDATSISRYGKRTLAVTELPIPTEGDAIGIAAILLAAYKDPMQRITSLGVLLYDSVTIAEVLSLDLGARVVIFRTHPSGGARIEQEAHVQKIQLSSRPGQPITITLGVSPL